MDNVIKLADLKTSPSSVLSFVLTEQEKHEIEHEVAHYPDSRAASIGALKVVQQHRGWVPDEAIPQIAKLIGMGAAELEGVATFYSLIFRKPVGRHVIKVCDSIACHLTGYDELKAALEQKLGIRYGQTTPDNRYTLIPICCLGNCDHGPTMMIDDDTHGDVAPRDLDALLERYA